MSDWRPNLVVVGHGKSAEGKRWGQLIDAAPIVLRMWNWHWQNKLDYGTKYDWGFYEINATEMARYWKHNQHHPTTSYIAMELHSNVGHKRYLGAYPHPTLHVDHNKYDGEGIKLGGMGTKDRLALTRGVRAAAWAIDELTQPGHIVLLIGFDNTYAGVGLSVEEGFSKDYQAAEGIFPFRDYDENATGKPKYGNHDFAIEAPLLHTIAKRKGVALVFSQALT